eukprot:1368243-Amorphochlora_amoeboformis.AAC.1
MREGESEWEYIMLTDVRVWCAVKALYFSSARALGSFLFNIALRLFLFNFALSILDFNFMRIDHFSCVNQYIE